MTNVWQCNIKQSFRPCQISAHIFFDEVHISRCFSKVYEVRRDVCALDRWTDRVCDAEYGLVYTTCTRNNRLLSSREARASIRMNPWLSVFVKFFQWWQLILNAMHRGKTSGNNVVAPTKDDTCCTAVEMRSREQIRCSAVKNADKVGFREMTVRVRYRCSPATVLRGSATFREVWHGSESWYKYIKRRASLQKVAKLSTSQKEVPENSP